MQCSECQHVNPEGAKFCNACATPVIPVCPSCVTENPAGAKFCHQCATDLQAPTYTLSPSQSLSQSGDKESRFHALIPMVVLLLQRDRRVTYRTLKWIFAIDDAFLHEVREELALRQVAKDEGDKALVCKYPLECLMPPAYNTR